MSFQSVNWDLTATSATESDLGFGNIAYDNEGSKYIKCFATGPLLANQLCMLNAAVAAKTDRDQLIPSVIISSGIGTTHYCIGAPTMAVTINHYFWCKTGPFLVVKAGTTGATLVSEAIYASATPGEVDSAVGTATRVLGVCVVDSASGLTTVRTYL